MTTVDNERIRKYIYSRRMVSVKNLLDIFGTDLAELNLIIKKMRNDKKIRTVNNCCRSSGSDCAGCESSDKSPGEIGSMIIISLNNTRLTEEE